MFYYITDVVIILLDVVGECLTRCSRCLIFDRYGHLRNATYLPFPLIYITLFDCCLFLFYYAFSAVETLRFLFVSEPNVLNLHYHDLCIRNISWRRFSLKRT